MKSDDLDTNKNMAWARTVSQGPQISANSEQLDLSLNVEEPGTDMSNLLGDKNLQVPQTGH